MSKTIKYSWSRGGQKPLNPHLRPKSSLWASETSYMISVGGYPTGRVDFRCFRCCLSNICGCKHEKWAKLSNIYCPGDKNPLNPHLRAKSSLWASETLYMVSVDGYPTGRVDFRCFSCCISNICGCKPEKWAKISNIYGPWGGQKPLNAHLRENLHSEQVKLLIWLVWVDTQLAELILGVSDAV